MPADQHEKKQIKGKCRKKPSSTDKRGARVEGFLEYYKETRQIVAIIMAPPLP
jgi:hypothetical protein